VVRERERRRRYTAWESTRPSPIYLHIACLHCTENPIYVFPEMKLRVLVPNSRTIGDWFLIRDYIFGGFLYVSGSCDWHSWVIDDSQVPIRSLPYRVVIITAKYEFYLRKWNITYSWYCRYSTK
jgi:hypothetical protein